MAQGMPSPTPGSANLASFSALRTWQEQTLGYTFPEAEFRQIRESTPDGSVGKKRTSPASGAVREGIKRFTDIPVPVLAVCAVPQDHGAWIERINDPAVKTLLAKADSLSERQASAFESGVPSSRFQPGSAMGTVTHYRVSSDTGLNEPRLFRLPRRLIAERGTAPPERHRSGGARLRRSRSLHCPVMRHKPPK